jgi:hypothetical protein
MKVDERPSREEMERLLTDLRDRAAASRRRRRAGRALGAALSFVIVAGALVWATSSLAGLGADKPTPQDSPDVSKLPSTYTFELLGFEFEQGVSSGNVGADVRISWSGDAFPGVRDCRLTALDADGNPVGTSVWHSLALTQQQLPARFLTEIPVDGAPSTLATKCGPRLDDGQPYAYDLGSPSVVRTQDGASIYLEATWKSSGDPGFVDCRFALLDSNGQLLGSRTIVEPDLGHGSSFDTWSVPFGADDLNEPLPDDIHRVFPDIACVPYVDGHEEFPVLEHPIRPDPVPYDISSPPGMGWVVSDVVFHPTSDGWVATYDASWENGIFPGVHACTVTLTDADGNVVGRDSGRWEDLQDHIGRETDATAQPANMEATCGPRLDALVAYVISNPTTITQDGKVAIEFTVGLPADLPSGAFVGTNQCVAALVRPGDVVTVNPFTLSAPSGTTVHAWPTEHPEALDAATLQGTTPVIKCEPFQGEAAMSLMVDDFVKQIEG